MNLDLLKILCGIYSPSGDEAEMKDFIADYCIKNRNSWAVSPEINTGGHLGESLIFVFGKPRTAVFVHMDTVGFMVRYGNQLVPVGSPEIDAGTILTGKDGNGLIETNIHIDEDHRVFHRFMRGIETGTYLVFKPDFKKKGRIISSPYLDNRIGIWLVMSLMPLMRDGMICFTCSEETGSGSAGFITRMIYEEYKILNALIADVTWASDGVRTGDGLVISLKDNYIPRRSFINKILSIAGKNGIRYQLEVEDEGSSDGGEIQRSPYPVDWAFIGTAGQNIHTSREKIDLGDVHEMFSFYRILLEEL